MFSVEAVARQEAQTVAIVAAILMSNQRVTDEDVAVEDARRIVQKSFLSGGAFVEPTEGRGFPPFPKG
jgi:hypothetical protein